MEDNRAITDEQEHEDAEKLKRQQEEQYLEDLRDILSRPSGLRVFKNFFERTRIFTAGYTGSSKTYYLEGQRSVGMEMFGDICEALKNDKARLLDVILNGVGRDESN